MDTDIKDLPDNTLIEEMLRRVKARNRGDCDWCGLGRHTMVCDKPDRHYRGRDLKLESRNNNLESLQELWVAYLHSQEERWRHLVDTGMPEAGADRMLINQFRYHIISAKKQDLLSDLAPYPSAVFSDPFRSNESEA